MRSEDNSPPIPPKISPQIEKDQLSLYLECFIIHKLVPQSKVDLLGELQNACVKIPLFQAIKDIPIYSNFVRELCLKKLGRKRKHPPRVHVIEYFAKLMMGNTLSAKYSNPGSPIVKVKINGIYLSNTLIDLGAAINVMTKQTMDRLGITHLRKTSTILQFPD